MIPWTSFIICVVPNLHFPSCHVTPASSPRPAFLKENSDILLRFVLFPVWGGWTFLKMLYFLESWLLDTISLINAKYRSRHDLMSKSPNEALKVKHVCVFVNECPCFLWIRHCCLPPLFHVYKWQTHSNWNKSLWEIRLSVVSVGKGAQTAICRSWLIVSGARCHLQEAETCRWIDEPCRDDRSLQVQDKFSSKRHGNPPLMVTWIQPEKRRIERLDQWWLLLANVMDVCSLQVSKHFNAGKSFISNVPLHSCPDLHVTVV